MYKIFYKYFAVADLSGGIIYGVSNTTPHDALLDARKNGDYFGSINNTCNSDYGERIVEISKCLYDGVLQFGGDVGFLINKKSDGLLTNSVLTSLGFFMAFVDDKTGKVFGYGNSKMEAYTDYIYDDNKSVFDVDVDTKRKMVRITKEFYDICVSTNKKQPFTDEYRYKG